MRKCQMRKFRRKDQSKRYILKTYGLLTVILHKKLEKYLR